MKIINCNEVFFQIVPDNPTELNKLKRFPGFRLIKGKYYIPNKPTVARNLIKRFKNDYKGKIACTKEFIDCMNTEVELKEIPKNFPWRNKPYPHQELALRYMYTHGSAGLLLEPGLGKTFVVLNYIKLMDFNRSLIICPKALLFVWEDEVKEHRPDLKVHVMQSVNWKAKELNLEVRLEKWAAKLSKAKEGTKEYQKLKTSHRTVERELEKLPALRKADLEAAEAADIIVINYEKAADGLPWLLEQNFDFISVDEGLIKNMKTARTKAIHKLGSQIPFRCIMSGTLINNGPLDAFSAIKFLESSLSGGAYGAFENYYAKIAQARGGRRFVAGVGRRQTAEIRDTLAACSIVMTKEEWLDLPDKHFHRIPVEMTDIQKFHYDELKSNNITEVDGKYIAVSNALVIASYLNQIANGFVYHYDTPDELDDFAALRDDYEIQEKGNRETLWIPSNKGAELRKLIQGDLKGRKFILWYNMQAEYEQIMEVLDQLGVESMSIKGGTKDTGATVHAFNKSGTHQVLVCQSQAVNYGITVLGSDPENLDKDVFVLPDFDTAVYTHVFWSLGWSLERFTQQQDRSHRIGQRNDVHYFILATTDGIEDLIWDRLSKKEEVRDAILVDYVNRR